MRHDDLVFEALAYRRNVGADTKTIRSWVKFKEKKKSSKTDDLTALKRLEKAGKTVQVGDKWFLTPEGLKLAKGNAMRPEWLPEDPWILMSLFLCKTDGADLENIIGAADYIDRSIPSLEQLHGALNRLMSGGLVKRRKGLYRVSEKAEAIFEKVKATCRRGVRSREKGLARILECPFCGVELKKVRWKIVISEAEKKQAYDRYIKNFQNR